MYHGWRHESAALEQVARKEHLDAAVEAKLLTAALERLRTSSSVRWFKDFM